MKATWEYPGHLEITTDTHTIIIGYAGVDVYTRDAFDNGEPPVEDDETRMRVLSDVLPKLAN